MSHTDQNVWDKPWIHLVWLGFLLVPAAGLTASDWLATCVAAAMLALLHLWSFRHNGPRLWLSRLAMFGIGVALFPYNSFAHTFFIYAGLPLTRARTRESIIIMALTVAASYVYFTWHQMDTAYFALVAVIVLGLGGAILYSEAEERTRVTIAGKDQEIQRLAKLAERERIARDLHDLLGHTLSLIAIKAELAHKLLSQNDLRADNEMREVAAVARKSLAEVRQAIAGLRSIGLLEAVRTADALLRAAGLKTNLGIQPLPTLVSAQEHALSQALLEATTNIVRHADASEAAITISCSDDRIALSVDDNGSGNDILPGNGLTGMRERLKAVAGKLEISNLAPGVRIRVELPVSLDATS
jgi:two-component system sensor histidine kinase DesK